MNKRRIFSIMIAAAVVFATLPMTGFGASYPLDENYRTSGLFSEQKLTQIEIAALLDAAPTAMPSQVFVTTPHLSNPYSTGEVRREVLERTTNRLNALRRIAGLTPVALDDALSANAQYGAVLLSVSDFSHYPQKPADMDQAFFNEATAATSTSNIAAGLDLTRTPEQFMNDSDSYNIDRLGHRRWQLNPQMGKIGFGYVVNTSATYQKYTCEKVQDRSVTPGDYDFISWPASGEFPNTLEGFASNSAWSVSLNTSKFSVPSLAALTVTVTRTADQHTWTLSGTQNYPTNGTGNYLNLNTQGFGTPLCIIFRPGNVANYTGEYVVRINGIKDASGQNVDFAYRVNFFNPDNATPPTTPPVTNPPTTPPVTNPPTTPPVTNPPTTPPVTNPPTTPPVTNPPTTPPVTNPPTNPPVEGGSGDVNGDGSITIQDALLAARYAMDLIALDDDAIARGDVDGSGHITVGDAIIILRRSMGLA